MGDAGKPRPPSTLDLTSPELVAELIAIGRPNKPAAPSRSTLELDQPPAVEETQHDAAGDAPSRAPMATAEPAAERLGRYVVLDEVGAGGMGVVYEAYDPDLDRRVALKLLPPGDADPAATARLLREAQAMAKLSHPNVVHIYDVGTVGASVYLTMQLVTGGTLKQWMREKPRPWREVLAHFVPAARGLGAAHAAGIIHRDFKPDNVLLGNDGSVRVVDFGLARPVEQVDLDDISLQTPGPTYTGPSALDRPLTRTGSLMGTPVYMAPEQHLRGKVDARSDQFSFCVALFEALFDQRPFRGKSIEALAIQVGKGEIDPPPRDAKVPKWLKRIVYRGLSTDPDERWPSMLALIHALERPPWSVRPRFALASGLVVLALGATAGYQSWTPEVLPVCGGAGLKLSGVWDDAERERMRESFSSSGLPREADLRAKTERQLDGHARLWARAYQEVCEATHVRHEQSEALLDYRMSCLDQRLWELDGVVEVLSTGEPTTLGNAAATISALRAAKPCTTEEPTSGALPPADGVIRERVASLRRRLADANALEAAGHGEEGLALAEHVVARAREIGYAPLIAESTYQLGVLQRSLGHAEEARLTLSDAAWLADEHRLEEIEARAKTELVAIVGLDLARPEQARVWARHARAAVRRYNPGGEIEAQLAYHAGLVERADGDLERARERLVEALTLTERSLGPGDLSVARALAALGDLELEAGLDQDAIRWLEKALSLYERVGEVGAPRADTEFALARALWAAGDDRGRALRLAESARARVSEPNDGPVTTWIAAHPLE